MNTQPMRVLIVDDEPLARRLLREYLGCHADIEIVGESEHGQDAVRDIAALQPDLVFLDIQMPGLTGLAQVSGRNELSWEETFALDVWYVEHASLALDLKILARTPLAVLSRRNAY